jgi:hypothetical protein
MIIGIAGSGIGVGKDTVADILVAQYEYVKLAFATELRREVDGPLTSGVLPAGLPVECAQAMERCIAAGDTDPFKKPTSDDMRIVLQQYGTEFRRAQDPDYWVKAMGRVVDRTTSLTGHGFYVISDVRFINEWKWINENGGHTWYVQGPARVNQGVRLAHSSEGLITPDMCDAIIFNQGTMEGLVKTVLATAAQTPGTIPIMDVFASNLPYEARA